MTISRVCYSNRTDVQRSVDFKPGLDANAAIDRALTSAADNIDGQMHRVFYPSNDTRYFDWPNQGGSGGGQYAQPWRLWLNENDLTCMSALVAGGVSIPLSAIFLEPVNNPQKGLPYYTYLELDRSQSYSFGNLSQTPQHSIAITGDPWGYGADADPAGTLAAELDSDDTTLTASDGSEFGPGDLIILGYGRGSAPFPSAYGYAGSIAPYLGERCLVTDVAAVATGLTQSGGGVSTASSGDNALSTTGTGALNAGEVIAMDTEDMLVEQITGVATVRRGFNGTAVQAHSAAAVYAFRQFSVARAQLGTTAASYLATAAIYRHRVPPLVRDLSIAEAANQVLQEAAAYARTVGSGEGAHPAPGISLLDKWDECRTRHGRKGRMRGV